MYVLVVYLVKQRIQMVDLFCYNNYNTIDDAAATSSSISSVLMHEAGSFVQG